MLFLTAYNMPYCLTHAYCFFLFDNCTQIKVVVKVVVTTFQEINYSWGVNLLILSLNLSYGREALHSRHHLDKGKLAIAVWRVSHRKIKLGGLVEYTLVV